MFSNISWTDYLFGVAVILTIYYLFVGIRYFLPEIKEAVTGKGKLNFKAAMPNDPALQEFLPPDENHDFGEAEDQVFAEVQQLADGLKTAVAAGKNLSRSELKQELLLVLREYPLIKHSAFRSAINELVVSECQKIGSVTLDEKEVDELWDVAG